MPDRHGSKLFHPSRQSSLSINQSRQQNKKALGRLYLCNDNAIEAFHVLENARVRLRKMMADDRRNGGVLGRADFHEERDPKRKERAASNKRSKQLPISVKAVFSRGKRYFWLEVQFCLACFPLVFTEIGEVGADDEVLERQRRLFFHFLKEGEDRLSKGSKEKFNVVSNLKCRRILS